jgi:hypothetical protein
VSAESVACPPAAKSPQPHRQRSVSVFSYLGVLGITAILFFVVIATARLIFGK